MSEAFAYPAVTSGLLEEIVDRILSAGLPLKIVLFGSRGRGEGREDSDIDLLIVEESDLPRHKRSARYYRALAGICIPKDVVVWTPDEIAEWGNVPNAFVSAALREGRTLYAK